MKSKTLLALAAAGILPLAAFAQTPPPAPAVPAVPAVPSVPATPSRGRDLGPKVPVTFLGVETSDIPSVVAEQLGLAKGFGLVVDYVVPDGPAAAAGVQVNDILKMFNDQILTEPDQLAKLVRSNTEGASVTLTILRKGAETKLTAKLGKREVSQRNLRGFNRRGHSSEAFGFLGPDFEKQMEHLGQLDQLNLQQVNESVARARAEAERAGAEAQRAGARARADARRVAEDARRMANGFRVTTSNNNGALRTTRIDLGKAQITYSDAQGEMRIETVDGKKMLTAKDPQGRLLFSGPITSKEELDKLPAEVRQRYEKLEQNDLNSVAPTVKKDEDEDSDFDFDFNLDLNDEDDHDSDNDRVETSERADVMHISAPANSQFPYRRNGLNTVLI